MSVKWTKCLWILNLNIRVAHQHAICRHQLNMFRLCWFLFDFESQGMFFTVSRFCMPWKSHRYYAWGQTILFMNSPDLGRCYCECEDESRSRQPLGTDCLRSYLLCVSASIKGRPSSTTGWFEASTSLLALLHAALPTLSAFILITHKYLLEKPQSNFLITPSSPQ